MLQNQDTGAKKEREIAAWLKQIWGFAHIKNKYFILSIYMTG
jgi:hypothetical protein